MNDVLTWFTTALLPAAGTAAAAVLVSVTFNAWQSTRALARQKEALRKTDTQAAIASADLVTLGFHLIERLGGTSVRAYVSDDGVREDLDRSLAAIRSFTAAPTFTEAERAPTAPEGRDVPLRSPTPDGDPMDSATWATLARARRDLEIHLRSVLEVGPDDRYLSAGPLITRATERGLITREESRELRHAVAVANDAIHGYYVPPEASDDAVDRIVSFLRNHGVNTQGVQPTARETFAAHVVPGPDGHWSIRGFEGKHSNRGEALEAARNVVWNKGGGAVYIHGKSGRIEGIDIVAKPSSRANTSKKN